MSVFNCYELPSVNKVATTTTTTTTTTTKLTEAKQASFVKPEVTCSLIYVTTHSKSKGRLVRMVDQNGSKFERF